jgi:hypothetical protein
MKMNAPEISEFATPCEAWCTESCVVIAKLSVCPVEEIGIESVSEGLFCEFNCSAQ